MPIDQPNFEAAPVLLEENIRVCINRGDGDYVTFFNAGSTTYQDGEPFIAGGDVWVNQGRTKPSSVGSRLSNFLVDVMVDPDMLAAINQDALVYIDTDITDAANPIGYATGVEPTNGFVLGRAVVMPEATSVVAAAVGAEYVRVRSSPTDYEAFSG